MGNFHFRRISSKSEGDITLNSKCIYILRRTQALMPNWEINISVALQTLWNPCRGDFVFVSGRARHQPSKYTINVWSLTSADWVSWPKSNVAVVKSGNTASLCFTETRKIISSYTLTGGEMIDATSCPRTPCRTYSWIRVSIQTMEVFFYSNKSKWHQHKLVHIPSMKGFHWICKKTNDKNGKWDMQVKLVCLWSWLHM